MTASTSVDEYVDSLPEELKSSPLAELARLLANRLDNCGTRETSALSKELRETLAQLKRESGKGSKGVSAADELKAKRAARLAGTANPARPASGEQRGARGG